MKRLALLALLAATSVLSVAQAGPAKTNPVLAVVGLDTNARLGYVDPVSLKFVGRSTQVGYYSWPAARSPDGSRLALARSVSYLPGGLRIIDLRRMRTVTAFRIGSDLTPIEGISALTWVAPRRILVTAGLTVAALDPVARRVVWRRSLPGTSDAVAKSADGFVFLSAPQTDYPNEIGPTTLTTVSASGAVRSVVLDWILTGIRPPVEDNPLGSRRQAGLAVDTAGNRAFVVGAGEPIAEVDLTTLAVAYHGGTRTLAKVLDGPSREATWLPNGLIAVTGYDGHVGKDANGNLTESETPAGLMLVDTRDWSARLVDAGTTSVAVLGDRLVTYSWCSNAGLGVYGLDGSPRLHTFEGAVASLQLAAGMAYATVSDGSQGWRLAIVDLAGGQVVRTVPGANFAVVSG